jgi:hypothetical protein
MYSQEERDQIKKNGETFDQSLEQIEYCDYNYPDCISSDSCQSCNLCNYGRDCHNNIVN